MENGKPPMVTGNPDQFEKVFKFYPNDLSLFEIYENANPVNPEIIEFEDRLKHSTNPDSLIEHTLDAIPNLVNRKPLIKIGYDCKAFGRDMNSKELKDGFLFHTSDLDEIARNENELIFFEHQMRGIRLALFEKYLKDLKNKENLKADISKDDEEFVSSSNKKKITFHGTPAQFAQLFFTLAAKRWIALPKSGEGAARAFLELFEFEGYNPSISSLGKSFQALNDDKKAINEEDAALFLKIPARIDLKK